MARPCACGPAVPESLSINRGAPCLPGRAQSLGGTRPRLGWWGAPSLTRPLSRALGFLQRTNSLEEKSRLVSAFRERQSSKNLLSCENSERDSRFRRTETDFSNLFARGSPPPCLALDASSGHSYVPHRALHHPSPNHSALTEEMSFPEALPPHCTSQPPSPPSGLGPFWFGKLGEGGAASNS